MKENKRIKTKIGVGSVVKEKFCDMEDNTREGRISRMRKYVVVCVQSMQGNNHF